MPAEASRSLMPSGREHRSGSRGPRALITWRRSALIDLMLAGALVVTWLTVPVAPVHLASSVVLVILVLVHLFFRRRTLRRLARGLVSRGGARRWHLGVWGLVLSAGAAAGTGIGRWLGVPAESSWHAAAVYLLLVLAGAHALRRRHRLRAQLNSSTRSSERSNHDSNDSTAGSLVPFPSDAAPDPGRHRC